MTSCRKPALFAALWLAVLHLPAPAYGEDATTPPAPPGVWTQVTSMSTPRWGAAAAAGADGRIYVFGGFNQEDLPNHLGQYLASAEAYNPKNKKWAPIAPMPGGPRDLMAAATGPDGRIYVMGGFVRPAPPTCPPQLFVNCELLDRVEAYDPATNTWATVAPMPTRRFGLAAATGPDGRIYAIGGAGGSGNFGNFVEAYDPATNTWATVAPMPTPRLYLAAATGADGRIYAIGGTTPNVGGQGLIAVNTVEAFNTATGLWEPVAPLKTPRFRLAAAASGADGRIYAIAGRDNNSTDRAVVEALRPGPLAAWQDVAPLKTPRQQLAAAADGNGRVYAIGGSSGPDYLSSVEVFTPPAVVRCTVNGTTVTSSPVNGTSGNDAIDCSQSTAPVIINGRAGNDSIVGGQGNDTINGGAGNDAINGGAGNDTINGGAGNDAINGGAGNDTIDGGAGNDSCNGGAGTDSGTACEASSGIP